jgi:hydrogenase nickel incorporation protein HypA/HybF
MAHRMHEFTITTYLVEALLDLVKQQGPKQVLEVHLKVGKLRALSVEQVKFSYEILAKGTVLEGSRLIAEETNGTVHCSTCNYREEFNPEDPPLFHYGLPRLECPKCGNPLAIEGGDECVITKVRMVLPSEAKASAEVQ